MIDIQQLINEAVEKRSQSRTSQRDLSFFHVSDAGTCYRKRYLKRMGVEPLVPIHVGALRKMLAGDAGHEMLQSTLKWYGDLFAAEGEVLADGIKGHFDAVIKTPENKVLLEFKTVEKWTMSHIKGSCTCSGDKAHSYGPKPEHLLQMFTYWSLMRKDYTQLDQATVVYVKREDFETVAFDYLYDDEISKKVTEEWVPLLKFWEAKELPPCTCNEDYGGAGIKYCRYISEDGESCCNANLLETIESR